MADVGGLVISSLGNASTYEWMQEYDGVVLASLGSAIQYSRTDTSGGGGGQEIRSVPRLVRSTP